MNLKPSEFNLIRNKQLKTKFGGLGPYKNLISDVYDLMAQNTLDFLQAHNITGSEANLLTLFIHQNYGNYQDFQSYLIVNKNLFDLQSYVCNFLGNQIQNWYDNYTKGTNYIDITNDVSNISGNANLINFLYELAQKLLAINGKIILKHNK